MTVLSRTVPVAMRAVNTNGDERTLRVDAVGKRPALCGLGHYLEFDVAVSGTPDSRSGYLLSISAIDASIRDALPGLISSSARTGNDWSSLAGLHELLRALLPELAQRLGMMPISLALRLTPFMSVAIGATMPDSLLLSTRFDFCASHRLHLPDLSDQENLARFGKCSLPSGHGHNYRLDVTIRLPAPIAASTPKWDDVVMREVIERFDHRHLNLDCPDFATLNPTVEHIAMVCHRRLLKPLQEIGITLDRVQVWETEKTWCSYPH